MHALVIDDSRALRRILSGMLKQLGFEVSEAGNGREALQRLEEVARPDVVLVDWNMPEMNGLEFVSAARADQRYAGLPMMMVTTETEMQQVIKALDSGVDEYMMKPFSKEGVAEKLELLGVLSKEAV